MKKNKTHLVFLVDRSGSMDSIKAAMEEAINGVMVEQKDEPGECTVSMYQFDTKYEFGRGHTGMDLHVVCENTDLNEVPKFILNPRGGTPLIDAGCATIDRVGEHLSNLSERERPEKVIFVLVTDGMENQSKEFKRDDLVRRIEHQRSKYKWTIMFLGANQDAVEVGKSYGVLQGHSMTYAATKGGVQSTSRSLHQKLKKMRGASSQEYAVNAISAVSEDLSFNDQDRAEATEE
tara:strand:+ start:751 stop:1452 length:702 start_codon:yes stop_codon:yes gene_type:complete